MLTGRPPADLTIPHGDLGARHSARADRRCRRRCSSVGRTSPRPSGRCRQQNAAIGVAFAGYYPSLTLSGAFGYSGDPFVRAIAGANPVWSYGLSVAQTLFNGGLTDAQVEAARQTYDGERRDLPPDGADRLSAGRGPARGDPAC